MTHQQDPICIWCRYHFCVCPRPEVITPIGREDRIPDIQIRIVWP